MMIQFMKKKSLRIGVGIVVLLDAQVCTATAECNLNPVNVVGYLLGSCEYIFIS